MIFAVSVLLRNCSFSTFIATIDELCCVIILISDVTRVGAPGEATDGVTFFLNCF